MSGYEELRDNVRRRVIQANGHDVRLFELDDQLVYTNEIETIFLAATDLFKYGAVQMYITSFDGV